MPKQVLDFVGLNTFIYEPCGYDIGYQIPEHYPRAQIEQLSDGSYAKLNQNRFGMYDDYGEDSTMEEIGKYKNDFFSHNIPESLFFPALMLRRNGPYGYPSFKQIRVGQNPLTRKQVKENVLTIIKEPGREVVVNNSGRLQTIRGKYGLLHRFLEAPISSRYKPFSVGAASAVSEGGVERFELQASYGNETIFFNNNFLNNYYNKKNERSEQYKVVTDFYLNGGLEKDTSPIDVFEYFKYKECVYPPRIYQYKSYVRQRNAFQFSWKEDRDERTVTAGAFALDEFNNPSDGFNNRVDRSIFPLDAQSVFPQTFGRTTTGFGSVENVYGLDIADPLIHGLGRGYYSSRVNYGILQNTYCFASHLVPDAVKFGGIGLDKALGVAPLYSRKHTLQGFASVVAPSGMEIDGINTPDNLSIYETHAERDLPSGEANWDAASGTLSPFYDTYDKYAEDIRVYAKDYTILPEFRISEHLAEYQSKGNVQKKLNLFDIFGSLGPRSLPYPGERSRFERKFLRGTFPQKASFKFDSSDEEFYQIYSNSDFMKHFEIVRADHKGFVEPMSITLKCKAIKKFLPYDGFYPAQRSVDLAKQFYDSYKDFVSVSGAAGDFDVITGSNNLFQNLMVPAFAPGIFFNTIKSGVAVDYPIINTNLQASGSNQRGNVVSKKPSSGVHEIFDHYLKNNNNPPTVTTGHFDWDRFPFEAIVEPEKHFAGKRIHCSEPYHFGNNSGSVFWNGLGDNLYKLMAHNFLAETNNFFMKKNDNTTIVSKPSSDPNVGLAEAGKRYAMRVKMYKSKNVATTPQLESGFGFYSPPQYSSSGGDIRETFTMYSRPSAFGPPQMITASIYGTQHNIMLGHTGENYAYTPPYYYGEAWAQIHFVAGESRKYSFSEIIASSSVYYYRYVNNTTTAENIKMRTINGPGDDWSDTNRSDQIAMNLDASVNLFSQRVDLPNSISPDNPSTRWVIQTKFETPMLNFNSYRDSGSVTLPDLTISSTLQRAGFSVPRGMWHQYGLIEEDPTKGIFLEVNDIPKNFVTNYMRETDNYESLVDLCGFSTQPQRLGQIKDEKTVFEAVVAVPFIEQEGERFFFRIARNDVARAFGSPQDQNRVGDSILQMLQKLRKYVLPPTMDFVNNPQIDPFAMYVFEFKHTFDQQDLANIWQNLYPKIGQTFETAESTITHQLLAHELLGGGAKLAQNGELDTNAVGNEIPDRVKWMVFKIKQRAKINYFENIYGKEKPLSEATVSYTGQNIQASYNWPYDFFSLVELAKIESEVKFAKRAQNPNRKPIDQTVAIPRTDIQTVVERAEERDPLFEKAITGQLPTPDDIPQPLEDGSDVIADTSKGSGGRTYEAMVEQDIRRGQDLMEQLGPSLGNPYGQTPLGDILFDIRQGFGPAGSVGGPDTRRPPDEGIGFDFGAGSYGSGLFGLDAGFAVDIADRFVDRAPSFGAGALAGVLNQFGTPSRPPGTGFTRPPATGFTMPEAGSFGSSFLFGGNNNAAGIGTGFSFGANLNPNFLSTLLSVTLPEVTVQQQQAVVPVRAFIAR